MLQCFMYPRKLMMLSRIRAGAAYLVSLRSLRAALLLFPDVTALALVIAVPMSKAALAVSAARVNLSDFGYDRNAAYRYAVMSSHFWYIFNVSIIKPQRSESRNQEPELKE